MTRNPQPCRHHPEDGDATIGAVLEARWLPGPPVVRPPHARVRPCAQAVAGIPADRDDGPLSDRDLFDTDQALYAAEGVVVDRFPAARRAGIEDGLIVAVRLDRADRLDAEQPGSADDED